MSAASLDRNPYPTPTGFHRLEVLRPFLSVRGAEVSLHEMAHYGAYRMYGIKVPLTLNTASPRHASDRKAMAEFAGPLWNLALAASCAAAARKRNRLRAWLVALALASSLMRLVAYLLVVGAALVTGSGLSLGNDEPIAAHLFYRGFPVSCWWDCWQFLFGDRCHRVAADGGKPAA